MKITDIIALAVFSFAMSFGAVKATWLIMETFK